MQILSTGAELRTGDVEGLSDALRNRNLPQARNAERPARLVNTVLTDDPVRRRDEGKEKAGLLESEKGARPELIRRCLRLSGETNNRPGSLAIYDIRNFKNPGLSR